ncbi:uncharacterized protein LOC106169005 [Lingula anatina]|uniref:Uncharacterized protein LOC106169005 n=1 Tax=Lingula anatina TaxID=7574 RepID=A0A1S3IZW6_LINAN|nr:uncharacterized protein LOC106169005 [Lingula anatina]|eukprot:XP_013403742.1 uncharacterized protein LOC106169005 [Lingula anatina]
MTVVPAAKIISNNTITSSSGAVTIPTTTTTTFNPYLPGPPYGPHSASGSTLSPKNKTLTDGVGIPDVNDAVCEHIITTYIIPNFLHFVAFVMGYFYFRIQDNEQLYALMEKVFLQAGPSQGKVASQSNMIKRLRLFLALGAVWVLAVMALQVLFVAVFGIDQRNVLSRAGILGQWILFGIELVGIIIVNSVNLAVIINFATQCEMLIFFIKGISTKLQEKSMDLKSAMKDVLMVRHSIGSLNGPMSQMTSLAAIRFAELTIIAVNGVQLQDTVIHQLLTGLTLRLLQNGTP